MIKIDKNTLFLAPMADITHGAFRLLVDHYGGCDYYFNEMISAPWILYGGPNEHYYESLVPGGEKLIFQLVGGEADTMVKAAHYLVSRGAKHIDINMGCAAPHIMQKGGGCAWMKNQPQAIALIDQLRQELDPNISLSTKIRLGESENFPALLDFVSKLEDSGLDFLTLHPKTRKEGKNRPPRWDNIDRLKESISIPIVGNGGATTPSSVLYKRRTYQNNGIMLGRLAVQRPWIFSWMQNLYKEDRDGGFHFNGSHLEEELSPREIDIEYCLNLFYTLLDEYQPKEFHKSRLQRFFCYFSKNFHFGYDLYHSGVYHGESADEIKKIVDKYLHDHPEERIKVDRGV